MFARSLFRSVTACTCFGQRVAAALAVLVSLTACSNSAPTQQVTLHIGFVRVQDALPYFVMQEQGFAKQHGLQLVGIASQSGPAILEAMAAGTIDAASDVGTVPVLAAAERGLIPGTIVPVGASTFADPEHPAVAVLAASSITQWHELRGQSIAINARNSFSAVAMQGRLYQAGIHDPTLVEIPFANMGLAVAGGNVAAAVLLEPWLTQSLLRGDGALLGWVVGGPPFERIQFGMIVFRAAVYRSQPQAVKAFLRAYLQAVVWIRQHPDTARSILARWLELSPEVAQQMKLPRWALDARSDPVLLERMQPLLVQLGLIKAPIPARQLYDETLLIEVLAAKR